MSDRISLDGLFSSATSWRIIAITGYLHSPFFLFILMLENRPENFIFLS